MSRRAIAAATSWPGRPRAPGQPSCQCPLPSTASPLLRPRQGLAPRSAGGQMRKWLRKAETPAGHHAVIKTVVTKCIQHRGEQRRPSFERGRRGHAPSGCPGSGRGDMALTSHVVQGVSQHPEHSHAQGVAEGAVVEVGTGVGLQAGAWV